MTNEIQIISNDLTVNEQTIKDGALELVEKSKTVLVSSQVDMEDAATMVRSLNSVVKKVEDVRKSKTQPLNDEVKAINDKFTRGIIEPLTAAAKSIEARMLAYTKYQRKLAEAEAEVRRKAEEEERFAAMILAEDAGEDDQIITMPSVHKVEAVAVPEITRSISGAVASVRKTWTFEVIDMVELVHCRPDLVEVATVKINAAIRDGERAIPGLRIYQSEKMGVR
jgi:hypothetical protein